MNNELINEDERRNEYDKQSNEWKDTQINWC